MSLQDNIALYLNIFFTMFSQNATAELELSCSEGKVNLNIFFLHYLGPVKQYLPSTPPVKKTAYNDNNIKTREGLQTWLKRPRLISLTRRKKLRQLLKLLRKLLKMLNKLSMYLNYKMLKLQKPILKFIE